MVLYFFGEMKHYIYILHNLHFNYFRFIIILMKINKRQMKYIKEMLACLYIELNNDEEKFVLSEFLLFQHNIEIFHK